MFFLHQKRKVLSFQLLNCYLWRKTWSFLNSPKNWVWDDLNGKVRVDKRWFFISIETLWFFLLVIFFSSWLLLNLKSTIFDRSIEFFYFILPKLLNCFFINQGWCSKLDDQIEMRKILISIRFVNHKGSQHSPKCISERSAYDLW